ncbi:hypothetical protein, partial [Borrelia sp. A-FGy1]|uniref:hypothetical protein n=1 Tax=Borrelia sp. A-FGy1 TaxID=2608247 RepID=UPI0015F54B33
MSISKILFVSCKLFRNNSLSKDLPLLVSASTALISNTPTATSSTLSTNLDKKENTSKLTKDDKDKLKSFFSKTTTYQSSLDAIYDKRISSYRTIDTYTDCSVCSLGCFRFSKIRSYAISDLENKKLEKEYAKLSTMLKEAVPGYDTKILDDAIASYRKAIRKASKAEQSIKAVNDYFKINEEKRKKNIACLKTVRKLLTVIKKTTKTACLSYADAFAVLASGLSCSKFRQAVFKFSNAAKKYTNGKGD